MEIKKLSPDEVSDFKNLVEIFNTVFKTKEPIPDKDQLSTLLANPDFMVFVAKRNDKVIGGLTIYTLHSYYKTKPVAYIYDVGVSPACQGQGIGKALIAEVCTYCKSNGFEEAYVATESEDHDALNFYRKTKFSSEIKTVHFTFSFDK